MFFRPKLLQVYKPIFEFAGRHNMISKLKETKISKEPDAEINNLGPIDMFLSLNEKKSPFIV